MGSSASAAEFGEPGSRGALLRATSGSRWAWSSSSGHIPRVMFIWRLVRRYFAITGPMIARSAPGPSPESVRRPWWAGESSHWAQHFDSAASPETQRATRWGSCSASRRGCCFPGAIKGNGPGNQNGNHKHAVRWRAAALYGASSEGGWGWKLIMPGSRVRVPPLLSSYPSLASRLTGFPHGGPLSPYHTFRQKHTAKAGAAKPRVLASSATPRGNSA